MLSREEFEILKQMEKNTSRLAADTMKDDDSILFSDNSYETMYHHLEQRGLVCKNGITKLGYNELAPYKVKRAVLMAAGYGSRMRPITINTPKPLVRVKGVRIIDTLIDALLLAEIEEIYVVRGYLSEQFDQLRIKYPMIKFVENPDYDKTNNISSIFHAGALVKNSYIIEADILLRNPYLIEKYQYQSNYLAIPVVHTDDYCIYAENGIIKNVGLGGDNCYQTVGISYWTENDGEKIVGHIKQVFNSSDGKQKFWGSIPTVDFKNAYCIGIRECMAEDVKEFDSYEELVEHDKEYDIHWKERRII